MRGGVGTNRPGPIRIRRRRRPGQSRPVIASAECASSVLALMGDSVGSNCSFIAFRSEPDIEKLRSIDQLGGFTLFKWRDREQWYLEGGLPKGESISFYEPLEFDHGKSSPLHNPAAKATVAWLSRTVDEIEGATFDDMALLEGLYLSSVLDISLLVVFGNDEDLDGALVCSKGALIGGSLAAGGEGILRITGERDAEVVPDFEDDPNMPNTFYRIAIVEAGQYFCEYDPEPHWSDPGSHAPELYERIAGRASGTLRTNPAQSTKRSLLDYFFKR